ncbi:hypothetical protein ACHQM5_026849 [Ranunculus cassubicifolius]
MKRVWKLSQSHKADSLLHLTSSKPKTLISPLPNLPSPTRRFLKHIPPSPPTTINNSPNDYPTLIKLFTEKKPDFSSLLLNNGYLVSRAKELSEELISIESDSEKIREILDDKAVNLISEYPDGSFFVELLQNLKPFPQLALQVFEWRRRNGSIGVAMVAEEYSKGITISGRLKNVENAIMLFSEASLKGLKTTSTYNALMGAYMYNNDGHKAQTMFRALKREITCTPTIVTYNILLTIFGRKVLVDHMEETYREIVASDLKPNLNTFNHMIAGYVTAWMWDDVERIYRIMEDGPIRPDLTTHLLMLRGYAHQGNLKKMEKTYDLVKTHVNEEDKPLIRTMICAYCKSSDKDRVKKVEALLKLIPECDYRPWLNVILIRFYAQADMVDEMESLITQAIEHKTCVTTVGIMRSIIASYFRCNAVERFNGFLKLAESSGWRICRSLYHCKMVMYSSANRLEEMETVVKEMGKYNMDPTRKTFMIMYRAYSDWGESYRRQKLLGTMCKHGFGIPLDAFTS